MKKKLIFILAIAIIGLTAYLVFFRIKSRVVLSNDLHAELNSKAKASDYIKEVKKGSLVEDANIDTSKSGKIKVTVQVEIMGKIRPYKFKVRVSDTLPPEIQTPDSINCLLGQPCELSKVIRVTDNSNEKIKIDFKGNVDSDKIGLYDIECSAEDKSGNKSNKNIQISIIDINENNDDLTFITSNGFFGERKAGITKVNGILIANKTFTLPSGYGPGGLTSKAADAWTEMEKAANHDGMDIIVVSGYRSYDTQSWLYDKYVEEDGKKEADISSARPGHSEHQTGLAVDINSVEEKFENTPEGKWLNNNAYKYGWILRYTKEGQDITGYIFEPWHYRYVGKKLAEELYNNGDWITIEEYFGIPSKYAVE